MCSMLRQRHLQRLPSLLPDLLQGLRPETSDGFTIGKCGWNDDCGLVMRSSRWGWGVPSLVLLVVESALRAVANAVDLLV